jgi:hypothetical protein
MTKQQVNWAAQVTWCERHLARVIELECSAAVIEGARRLLAHAQALAAQA